MALKLVAAPANYPVTLDQAKAHLRVDFADDDDLISSLIDTATTYCDGPKGFLGRALISQTWDLYLDEFPCRHGESFFRRGRINRFHHSRIEIPLPPLIDVVGVFYLDGSGEEQELDASKYIVDDKGEQGMIFPVIGWPIAQCVPNAVRVRFTAGYVDDTQSPQTDKVPGPIKSAMLLYMGDLYANRETMLTGQRAAAVTLPWAAEQMLRPYRFTLSIA